MNIQSDYDQLEILLDELIKSKISNYHKVRNYVILKKNALKMFLDYLLLLVEVY